MEKVQPTQNQVKRKVNLLGLRAQSPQVLRAAAILALALTILVIGIAFYRSRGKEDFRLIQGMPELSKDVVASVSNYERRETENNVAKYFIKADKATTFTDNHQELENPYIEVYDEKGEKFDKISSQKAVYVPAADKNFNAFLLGSVNIETRNGLKLKSEQITYERATETAHSEVLTEFSRENLSGKSVGAIARIKDKHLELLKDVELDAFADNSAEHNELGKANIQRAKIVAGHAVIDENTNQAAFDGNVSINLLPLNNSGNFSQPTDIHSEKATAFFENKEIKKFDLTNNVEIYAKPTAENPKYTKARGGHAIVDFDKEMTRAELDQNVEIETTNNSANPTNIKAQNAVYDKASDRFDLKTGVEIVTNQNNQPTQIHSNEAIYEQTTGRISLNGAAQITQSNDLIKGDNINAELFPDKKLRTAAATGNAYLKQSASDRTTEITANQLNAAWGNNRLLQNARANQNPNVTITPAQSQDYSKLNIAAPNFINLDFRAAGAESVLSQTQTDGRTTILMTGAAGNPNSSNRRLVADAVKTQMGASGKDLQHAEAVGNAELYVEPLQSAPGNYRTTMTAPRFDCDFFETGNNAKVCTGSVKAKAVQVPTVPAENRGTRTLTADKLTANFNQNTQAVERLDADGSAKFNELDRSGIASQIVYTQTDETVRLRGGEPTVWDSEARAKASEIDWNTREQKSYLRNKVSTTYYSQKQTNGATPFGKTNAPVFITANEANFDHQNGVGVYTGNARAWQDNNYVRADKLSVQEKSKRLDGEGRVQSLLYDARRKEGDRETTQAVFAAADRMSYTDENKQLHYESNVDIRQGTDRIAAGVTDVFLTDNNEVRQSISQNNVVITQPARRATGAWAQYTAADDTIVLRGNPATVTDAENGSSQGSQMTVSMRDNRVVNQGAAKPSGTGRTRTIYKVKPQ